MTERAGLMEELLRTQPGWMLCLIGEDQSAGLGRLINGLSREPSSTGDGKIIESGFSYWGVGPTVAWERACTDPAYLVMRESIRSFRERWQKVSAALPANSRVHYVSLGVGTGHKDAHILKDLATLGKEFCYFPVDMSASMLTFGVQNSTEPLRGGEQFTYPIQLDFSNQKNLEELRRLIWRFVGDEPILFSLLGNTIANFTDDTETLKNVARILRPQDRLLLEVAYTEIAEKEIAHFAADEYRRSQRFKLFVTSALLQNTDLPMDLDRVDILPTIEDGRAICLKVIYKSVPCGEEIILPDRIKVRFPNEDTIRLLLTRKYTKSGASKLILDAGCYSHQEYYMRFLRDTNFGLGLHLLSQRNGSVFVSYSHKDKDFVEKLREGLLAHNIYPWTDFVDTDADSKLFEQIKDAMQTADKLLLVFSEASRDRDWVKAEVRLAFQNSAPDDRSKLRVLLLTSIDKLQVWQCLNGDGVNLASKLLEYPQEDFADWRQWSAEVFDARIGHLAKGLLS